MSDPGGGTDGDPCVASGPDGYYDQSLNIAAVFIILIASLLGTVAPLFFQRHPRYLRYPFVIVIGKHIGTGVLLALALIHLLGPAVQTLTDACLPASFSTEYSYSPLFAMLSAILMHFIENSVLEYTIYSKQGGDDSHSHSHGHGHEHGRHGHGGHGAAVQLVELRPKGVALSDSDSKEYEEVVSNGSSDGGAAHSQHVHSSESNNSYHGDPVAMKQAYQRAYDQHTKVGVIDPAVTVPDSPLTSPATTPHSSSVSYNAFQTPSTPTSHNSKGEYDSDTAAHTLEAIAGHSHGLLIDSTAERTVGAYILEFGLTAHSVIIGITVGVASHSDLVSLIPALTFHQFFEGFALGARLASCHFSLANEAVLAVIYSSSAPIGIAIGIGVANSYEPNSTRALLTQGTFDSVSAGILLYVAFVQMLAYEFAEDYKKCGRQWTKKVSLYLAMWCGAAVMAVIGKWL